MGGTGAGFDSPAPQRTSVESRKPYVDLRRQLAMNCGMGSVDSIESAT